MLVGYVFAAIFVVALCAGGFWGFWIIKSQRDNPPQEGESDPASQWSGATLGIVLLLFVMTIMGSGSSIQMKREVEELRKQQNEIEQQLNRIESQLRTITHRI